MKSLLKRLWHDENGATVLEYGLILVILSVCIVGASNGITGSLSEMLSRVIEPLIEALSE